MEKNKYTLPFIENPLKNQKPIGIGDSFLLQRYAKEESDRFKGTYKNTIDQLECTCTRPILIYIPYGESSFINCPIHGQQKITGNRGSIC